MSEAMIIRRGGANKKLQTKTIAPSTSQQVVTPDSGYDGFESITVSAITPTKSAQTYTPSTSNQTISSGQWLTGAQKIKGDANLVAGNIKKGVSIFNVAGSYEAALDTNSAILKVVTSTGCSVSVTNGTDTFTQQDADGFVRTGDANVTEHFFVIPTAAFGTFDVTSTHPTYGDNTKANAVVIGSAGKVYEVLCGGKNILLSPALGAQDGFDFNMSTGTKRYDADYKCYFFKHNNNGGLSFDTQSYDLGLYDNVVLKGVFTGYSSTNSYKFTIKLIDKDGALRRTIIYSPYTSGNNMEVSVPVEDKTKSPYTLKCNGSASTTSSFRLNEFYFE